jgi:hypothetical protein
MDLAAAGGLRISAYTAEPGTLSHDALNLLASWAATLDQADTARAINGPDPQRQSLLADPRDDTRRVRHGTMVMPRLGFAGTEDPRTAGRRAWSQ